MSSTSSTPNEYFIYYFDADGLNGVRWTSPSLCAVYWKNSLVENHDNKSFTQCIDQAKNFWPQIITEIKKPIESVQVCKYPNYDPLFTAIYIFIPVVMSCALIMKIMHKIFSAGE